MIKLLESGECRKEIDRIKEMISPYVEKDPSAFYTFDEFNTGVDTLKAFINARAESIRLQLDGKLSTNTSEQDTSARVDGSGIQLSAMGSQNEKER